MIGILCSLIVLAGVVYLLAKNYTPQAVLLCGGLVLLACTALFNIGPLLGPKQTTNLIFFDIFETFKNILSSRVAGLGLMIMSIGGFARYMDHVGASKALFALVARPLRAINSPYLLLAASFLVSQVLVIFIPSHSGLGLLLMVTLYPLLLRAGVSKLSALGVIGCAQYIDAGPGSGNALLAAKTAGIDVAEYFIHYQLVVFVPITLALAVVHYFVQRWWDKKEGYIYDAEAVAQMNLKEESDRPPLIYAALPILPLVLIIGFSKVVGSTVKMDVVTAMVISTLVSMLAEFIRSRDLKSVLQSLMLFFDGLGRQLTNVVSLIVCGEFFAAGLIKIGAVKAMIDGAQSAGLGLTTMVIVGSLIMAGTAFIMGSGNAAFFSFAPLTPQIASAMGVSTVTLLFPLQIMTSFGRVVSPITAAIVGIAGIAGVSPFQVVKRTAIPMLVAAVMNLVLYFALF